MPYSDTTAHPALVAALKTMVYPGVAHTFLDCGVGAGWTAVLIQQACPIARITGLEIYAPYVLDKAIRAEVEADCGLYHCLYESMVIGKLGDFRLFLPGQASDAYDFVIFGDSLEHVTRPEGEEALAAAQAVARRAVVAVVPSVRHVEGQDYVLDQGEVFGNEHEAHLTHWWPQELESFGGRAAGHGKFATVYVWEKQRAVVYR